MVLPARMRCDQTPAWRALQAHFNSARVNLRDAFSADAQRFARFSQAAPHVFADLSKNLIDPAGEALLLDLAQQCGVAGHRDAMFAGAPVNTTEQRAAMHFLLRTPADAAVPASQQAELQAVHATLDAFLAFAEQVRADDAITDVVNIGIGGSDLGPHMAVRALEAFALPGKRFHFVSNLDAEELLAVLRKVQPQHTLFLVASKSFTTLETMGNARAAKAWFEAGGGRNVARHFVGLTSQPALAQAFGIDTTFDFADWVGGRYSLWSAIGLSLAMAIGAPAFRDMLAGAHAMDRHFREAPLAQNLPVRLALLDVWYRNFHQCGSRSMAPYSSSLRRLPAYLQQLEMESNGKGVAVDGTPLAYATSPVVWGQAGTNGQHAYFQMLHQGSDVVPVEFIAVRELGDALPEHHRHLLANALAQAQALMLGKPGVDGHRHFPGNRPSTFLLLDALTPTSLGALVALYEHRVFVAGSLWGINSFDQFGVELGKQLAQDIAPRLQNGDVAGLDASTAGLLRHLQAKTS
ncbi:MAG: glucose-6-phosphate isomerase [Pseudomonadota bacterium]